MITFSISQHKSSKSCPVFVHITDNNGVQHRVKTPLRTAYEHWDTGKQSPVNIYLKSAKALNRSLNLIKTGITEYAAALKSRGSSMTTAGLAKKVKHICLQPGGTYAQGSLLHYTQQYIRSREHYDE